jgi:hypothetical protein
MEEQASFETRAVLAPKRARRTQLAIVVPAVALIGVAWAGLSGPRSDPAPAEIPDPTVVAAPSLTVEAARATPGVRLPRPDQIFGLDVQQLDAVQSQGLGRDDIVVVAGWYVATAITDCPALAAIYRDGALPYVRGDADELAFCVRRGVLYASPPLPFDGRNRKPGLQSVAAEFVVGVIAPRELEVIGADATEVVLIGRFVESGAGCRLAGGCSPELIVDHVAWTPGA